MSVCVLAGRAVHRTGVAAVRVLLPEHRLPPAAALGPRGGGATDLPRMKLQTQRRWVITGYEADPAPPRTTGDGSVTARPHSRRGLQGGLSQGGVRL